MKKINRLLIANRGEIAVRIIKTAQKMNIHAISIYSDIDRESPHVLLSDEAYPLHGTTPGDSYLSIEKIIKIARESQADAIHPGYGFLSENATFADAVKDAGIIFVGPSANAIQVMGNKIAAKEAVIPFNVPLVPGVDRAITDMKEAKSIAEGIGYPVLIKAAAGGGGKGMRIVNESKEFDNSFERAVSEAESAFGDGSVFIEKYIEDPKHIEVQIIADNHDNILYLFERECSIQRRHQKVIEEAPSPSISSSLRKSLGETAVNVARSCHYTGAGTVEFIMDKQGTYFFLEMNTRLQVEHPVTELIVDIDLVEQQIRVAENKPLEIKQEDLKIIQHAIELRVYAEDPKNNFLPSPGILEVYKTPQTPKTRVDDGVRQGSEISVYYDPMISKLIAYGRDRSEAIHNLIDAIDDYQIEGVANTLEFGKFVLKHPAFIDGSFTTHFVKRHFSENALYEDKAMLEVTGKLAAFLYDNEVKKLRLPK